MGRAKKTPFPPWETMKKTGIEERYIRMGNSQMLHPHVLKLTHAAYRVYTHMKLESGGKREYEFPKAKWRAFISPAGFQSAKKELCDVGLIEVVQCNANIRKPNIYRFSCDWKTASIEKP